MTLTKQPIKREGRIHFGDASLSIWEEGISAARAAGGYDAVRAWERQFKSDVFARIVQQLRRLGWTVGPQTYIFTTNNSRFCQKGDLKADLRVEGRHLTFEMFQSVNCPDRADHEGRYQHNKRACMPYPLRLEMERTRDRITNYLLNVIDGYVFDEPKPASPNPDPLAYFNGGWDGEYEKKRGTHRFKRGPDGWPDTTDVHERARIDADGTVMNHGDVRWMRDPKGRLLRGRVYGGINEMWMMVYGPGRHDYTHQHRTRFFTYKPGMPMKQYPSADRRKRLEQELAKAIKAMKFERAAKLRDVLYPSDLITKEISQ